MSAFPPDPRPRGDDHDYPMVGETLGLWRLLRGLGRGGMGEVYEAEYDYLNLLAMRFGNEQRETIRAELARLQRAEQARLAQEMLGTPLPPDARFAIKVCNARTNTAGHKRFLQEAEVAQRLGDHPYIVTVHAVNGGLGAAGSARFELDRGRYRDVAFMVMDLASRDYDHTQLTIPEAVHIVRCIATALDHAHSHGIIHRDLKPENILGSIQHPLLTDFGIAKEIDQTEGLTRTGQIIGTLDYMSPEQATDAKRVDHRSDVYSLGVVLYEFATQGGLPYFHKQDRESCLAAIRSERTDPKWPREHLPGFPAALERIVLKAMSHRMEDRYQAMSDFINDLDRFSRGEWIAPWGHVRMRSYLRYNLRRHPRLIWGSVGVAGATALTLLVLWLLPLLDSTRRSLEKGLDQFEKLVLRVETGNQAQPGKNDLNLLRDLHDQLRVNGKRYPEQDARHRLLDQRLRESRWLEAYFKGTNPRTRLPFNKEEMLAAKEEFELAADAKTNLWSLTNDGLLVTELCKLRFGPYGKGTIYVNLQLRTREGFLLRIKEDAEPARHLTDVTVRDNALQVIYREGDRPGTVLWRAPLPADGRATSPEQRLVPVTVAIECSDRIRLHVPRGDFDLRGLSDGAAGVVHLELPRDTVIGHCEIWPRGPQR